METLLLTNSCYYYGYIFAAAAVRNPYFGIEHKIFAIPCQSRDFPPSYAVIATIVHPLFHYFLSLGSLLHF